jgi:molybdopterin synthase sulfur carrier subunit
MAIEVRVPTVLRKHTSGSKAVSGAGTTIREVIEDVDKANPGLREAVVTENGDLHRFINVYLNDEDVRFLGSLETPVRDGDVIAILPAVAGGAR